SSCAFENAPSPASQICWAESRTVSARFDSLEESAMSFSLLTMSFPFRWSEDVRRMLGEFARGRTLMNTVCERRFGRLLSRLFAPSATIRRRKIGRRLSESPISREEFMAYFVTGASGFIGKRLVSKLLARNGAVVYFLIREKGAPKKIKALQAYWKA